LTTTTSQPGFQFPKAYSDFVARLRVPIGFILVAAFAWFSTPSMTSLWAGALIALPGLLLRGWAAGHLRKNSTLTKSGPYRFVRNPLYVGTLIVALGMAHATQQVGLLILFLSVFLLVYLPAITLEEQHLNNLFPDFHAYRQQVPLLIPYRKPLPVGRPFEFSLYMHNREYEAALGFLIGMGLLFAKANWMV